MIKAGQVEKTNDREYEVEERRYHTMEAAATKLQKEAKGYLDSLRGTSSSLPSADSNYVCTRWRIRSELIKLSSN